MIFLNDYSEKFQKTIYIAMEIKARKFLSKLIFSLEKIIK